MRNLLVLSILSLRKTSAIVTPEQFHRRSVNWLRHSFSPSSTPSRAVKPSNGSSLHFFSWGSLSQEQNPKAASLRGCLQREEENKWTRVPPCVDCNCSYRDHPSTNKTLNNLTRARWNTAVRFQFNDLLSAPKLPSKLVLASWWNFHTLEQILNNNLTHLVFWRPCIAARTMIETKERSQTRALIVCFFYVSRLS